MANQRSHRGRGGAVGVLCAALLLAAAGCGTSDVGVEAPSGTGDAPSTEPPSSVVGDDPVPTDRTAVEVIQPFLSSSLDDGEFAEPATSLFGAWRIIDTDDLRAEFIALAGGPADQLDEIDLGEQFVLVATTGQCVIPSTPPTLEIGPNDAVIVDVDESGDVDCYRQLTVVHFFAVDLGYRDRFPTALDHLDDVIGATDLIDSDAATPGLLARISVPTFVEGDADHAALALEVTDEDTRRRVTSFVHQAKLLVPVDACDPQDVTVRIRMSTEAVLETIDPTVDDCDATMRSIAVFTLGDRQRDLLRQTAPATWTDGLVGESVTVTPSGPERIFVREAAVGDVFDDLETHRISTAASLAQSTLGSDVDVDVASTGVDLATQFLVVVVRRDCDVLRGGNGIVIGEGSWQISPPVPESLDCDLPNLAVTTYRVDRRYIGVFDDVPEGRP
ncbi:MAG: hypothetical protein ABJH68_09320 [Ilumatobacter sp.]|uniref:hypothetical protein n=1 Tax=Ilumatobacter sp. TaxID=1967498 RepID=UPI003298C374